MDIIIPTKNFSILCNGYTIFYNKSKNETNNFNYNNNYHNKNYNDKIVYIDSILDEMDKYVFSDFDHRFPFYKIRATVTHLGHTEKNFYAGCPNRECNRKVSTFATFLSKPKIIPPLIYKVYT